METTLHRTAFRAVGQAEQQQLLRAMQQNAVGVEQAAVLCLVDDLDEQRLPIFWVPQGRAALERLADAEAAGGTLCWRWRCVVPDELAGPYLARLDCGVASQIELAVLFDVPRFRRHLRLVLERRRLVLCAVTFAPYLDLAFDELPELRLLLETLEARFPAP